MNTVNVVIPAGVRAMLVWNNNDGSVGSKPVPHDSSVLDISRDLKDHISEYPHSDAWLIDLRDYIDQRLAARQEARATGGLSMMAKGGSWQVRPVSGEVKS